MSKRYVWTALACLAFLLAPAYGTNYYVDSSAPASGNGLSWTTAWQGFSNITGLQPGDTVYFSGGSSSQTYSVSSWTPTSGSSGSPITYTVGQDAGHNGTVAISSGIFLAGTFHDVVINGNVNGTSHLNVTASGYFWEGGSGANQRVAIRYVTVSNESGGFHWAKASNTSVEIDHNNIMQDHDYTNIHDFIFYGGPGTGAHQLLVHDNVINLPYYTTDHDCGDDMWIWPGNVDFYNNTVQYHKRDTYTNTCPGTSQHSDVFQTSLSSNINVYANTIIDPGESIFYEDSQSSGSVSNIAIYNNLFVRSYDCAGTGGAGVERGIDFNPEPAASSVSYTDIVIANNTAVDGFCNFFVRVQPASGNTLNNTRVFVVNNLQYPSGDAITVVSGVTNSSNYAGSATQFVSYKQYGGQSNDLHLKSTDTTALDKGTGAVATYFSTDKDGAQRPQGAAWDIGAYEFGGVVSTGPAPPTMLTAAVQ